MPALPIIIHGVKNHIPVLAIVDSGADYTFIPVELASHLGIELDDCVRQDANTAGGPTVQYIWQAGLEAEIQQLGITVHLRTAFSGTPLVLLGREDFFASFKVAFDQRALQFTLEPY